MNLKGLKWDGKGTGKPLFPKDAVFTDKSAPPSGKVNVYTCNRGHETVTRHMDDGVTPFNITCRCGGMAQSCFYECNQNPDIVHAIWMNEPNSWWGDKEAQQDHAREGGVFLYYLRAENQLAEEQQ